MVSASGLIPILTGPTATGKTAIALELASRDSRLEIINADSMLVYRGMDIGTAKPSPEDLRKAPHHLIDCRNPDEPFTAGDFVRGTEAAIDRISSRGGKPLIVGGTGFYLKALLYGLWEAPPAHPEIRKKLELESSDSLYERLLVRDEASALRIGKNDRYRLVRAWEIIEQSGKSPTELQENAPRMPDPRFRLLVIDRENEELFERVAKRTEQMLAQGLIEETRQVLERFSDSRALDSVGYAQVRSFLQGMPPQGRKIRAGVEGLQDEIELATRQLIKRQRTWFRAEKSSIWFTLDQDRQKLFTHLKETLK